MLKATNYDGEKFSTTPYQKKVEKPWGHEIIYTRDDAPATGKILHVRAGKRLSLQYHDQKIETLCLIKGEAKIALSNNQRKITDIRMELFKGYLILPGQLHRVTAITDVDFIEASMPEIGNTYRVEDDAGRPTETEEIRKLADRGWDKK